MINKFLAVLMAAFVLSPLVTSAETKMPAVAGAFYPDNPKVLRETVDRFLSEVKDEKGDGRLARGTG